MSAVVPFVEELSGDIRLSSVREGGGRPLKNVHATVEEQAWLMHILDIRMNDKVEEK